ncbi:MAG: pitrilysin family protein [Planctomycetota bacterium]
MPVTFKQAELGNGLTIIGEVDPDAHTAACGFFVRTGARDEDPAVMGVSHFLEHMMFKGTESRSADDVNRGFDEIGASYNAYTSNELTCFYASTLPEHIETGAEILSDILRPSLRGEDFDTEKGVILEEIAMYKDNPFWVLYEKAMEVYYGAHPLAHRVLGTDDTIKALQRDQMQAYFDNRYSADNTTVALSGNLDFDAMIDRFNTWCGSWARTGAERSGLKPTATDTAFDLQDENVNRGYWLMITPAPAMEDERRYAAMLLAKLLGDPGNSRLHWALVEPGTAEETIAAYDPRDGTGDYLVYASGEPDRLATIGQTINAEINGLIDAITDDDLERLRNKLATSVVLAGERPGGRMQRLGRQWTYLRGYMTLEEELERINAITLKDLRELTEAFPFTPRTIGTMTPKV